MILVCNKCGSKDIDITNTNPELDKPMTLDEWANGIIISNLLQKSHIKATCKNCGYSRVR